MMVFTDIYVILVEYSPDADRRLILRKSEGNLAQSLLLVFIDFDILPNSSVTVTALGWDTG